MNIKGYLPTQRLKYRSYLFVSLIILLYIIDNSLVKTMMDRVIYNNIFKPILWMGLGLGVLLFPSIQPRAKLRHRSFINLWAFNFAIIYIILSYLAGIIDGFGKSPYRQTVIGIIMNIFLVGSSLLAGELARNIIIVNLTEDENYLVFIAVSLLMTLSKIPLSRFIGLGGAFDILKFIGEYLAPEFSHNLLATYLTFLAGAPGAIIYLASIQLSHWLLPILPDLQWISKALIGILCPIFSLMGIQAMYLKEAGKLKKHGEDEEGLAGWIVTSVLSIGIIWFAVGVFPIYPSVIATGSMEPMIYPGDLILIKKIRTMEDIDNLQPNDVIQFKKDKVLISHRIDEIIYDKNGERFYRTKGDNNQSVDSELISPQELRGKILKVVPKVGWPTLLMRRRE